MEQVKKLFNCSYPDLLLAAAAILVNAQKSQTELEIMLPGFYTPNFFEEKEKSIKDAENLPGYANRTRSRELVRNRLIEMGQETLLKANFLSRSIERAFSGDDLKTYRKVLKNNLAANAENWEALSVLLQEMEIFTMAKSAELIAKGNMNPDLLRDIQTLRANFLEKYSEYVLLDTELPESTGSVRKAFNDIYTWVRLICDDGQALYSKNPEMRQRFVFDEVLAQVVSTGVGGIRVAVSDEQTGSPIADVLVTLLSKGTNGLTNAEGRFAFNQVAAGLHNVRFEVAGYFTTIMEDFEVLPGVSSKLSIQLKPTEPLPPEEVQRIKSERKSERRTTRKSRSIAAKPQPVAPPSAESAEKTPAEPPAEPETTPAPPPAVEERVLVVKAKPRKREVLDNI